MSEVRLMLGNEAIARGAYEAGVKVSAAYPGTPSTEINESLAQYTASGRPMKRPHWKRQSARRFRVCVLWPP